MQVSQNILFLYSSNNYRNSIWKRFVKAKIESQVAGKQAGKQVTWLLFQSAKYGISLLDWKRRGVWYGGRKSTQYIKLNLKLEFDLTEIALELAPHPATPQSIEL